MGMRDSSALNSNMELVLLRLLYTWNDTVIGLSALDLPLFYMEMEEATMGKLVALSDGKHGGYMAQMGYPSSCL